MRLDARGIEWYSMNAQLLSHLVLFQVILPFLDYGLAGKSCSYSSQSQLRRRATIGLVLIVLSIWNRQILYMLRTCFRATATVSSLLWGEWLRVWLWSLNSQLNLALLQEWARSEWSIWTLKTVCLMLRKHVGIRDFLSTVETGFRDHRSWSSDFVNWGFICLWWVDEWNWATVRDWYPTRWKCEISFVRKSRSDTRRQCGDGVTTSSAFQWFSMHFSSAWRGLAWPGHFGKRTCAFGAAA